MVNLQSQELQQNPRKISIKTYRPKHITGQQLFRNREHFERREKFLIMYRITTGKITADFILKIIEVRRQWDAI